MAAVWAEAFWKAFGAGLAAALLAMVTVFSDKIAARIRLALNRADLRVKQFEEMALDLSDYAFHAELSHEFIKKGWDTPEELAPIIRDYNAAITTVRKKEFVYRSWVRRYWRPERLVQFEALIQTVKRVDGAVHDLNDSGDMRRKLEALETLLGQLREQVDSWLSSADA
ncbi:MAG TPA: hypothetical protein VM890_10005 [Longimicrobium sp.]|nr:hypothetical protein [Longimicrobium sp.]